MGAVAYIQPALEAGIYRELTVSEVDRISHALGRLVAEAEESKRQRRVLYDKIDRLEREHGEIASLLRQHVEEQVRHEDDIRKTYEHLIEPTLRDYRAVKNRALGVLAMVAAFGAGLVELIRLMLAKYGV